VSAADHLPSPLARGLIGGAVLIAAVTVVARAVGFGRWVVFAHTVRGGCLADVYNTANLLPNVLFEVVAGGALAGAVVPVLVGPIARGDRAAVDRTVSALLTWALTLLVPVTLAAALAARPLMRLFLGSRPGCGPAALDVGTRMLLIFLPQLLCYAVAVVLSGTLTAHRRFLAAALAPLVSSVVVIGSYLLFRGLANGDVGVATVPTGARTALAVGTTAGVVALAATVAVPALRTGVRLRPVWSWPDRTGRQVGVLAAAGIAAVVAQQGHLLVVAWLANHQGPPGAVTAYTWAAAVFLLPYAALSVPIATSAFPRIAEALVTADTAAADVLTAATTRTVLAAGCLGAAVTAATAVPVSRVFVAGTAAGDAPALADGIAALAPGLVGYALIAHLSRVLYAAHHGGRAAAATVAGWLVAAGGAAVAVVLSPSRDAVRALGLGSSFGLTVGGALLLSAVRRCRGGRALDGVARTGSAAAVAAAFTAVVGHFVGAEFSHTGVGTAVAASAGVGLGAAAVFVALLAVGDRDGLRSLRIRPQTAAAKARHLV